MTQIVEASDVSRSQRRPAFGFLFQPFGWMTDWFTAVVEAEPALLADICSITSERMHLIGFVLAHLESHTHFDGLDQRGTARLLLRGRTRDILDRTLGYRPRGLEGTLGNLSPLETLSPENYRHLLTLLDDPAGFKLLTHSSFVGDDDLQDIFSIPVALFHLFTFIRIRNLDEGFQLLVMRGAAPNYNSLVDEFKSFQQMQQLRAHVRRFIDSLSFPELPPSTIGPARRLDRSSEIRDLARSWRNCLESRYLPLVDEGRCVIYLWDDPQVIAACAVRRRGRLGWFLTEVDGPRNAGIKSDQRSRINRTFTEAGIPLDAAAFAILTLAELDDNGQPRRQRRYP